MLIIEESFKIEDEVYLRTDPEQNTYLVTGIIIRPNGLLEYILSHNGEESYHYDIEISAEKNQLLKC